MSRSCPAPSACRSSRRERRCKARSRRRSMTSRIRSQPTPLNAREITAQLRTEIPHLAASIERVANTLNGTVGENRQDVKQVVENLRKLSTDLKATTENL